MNVLIRQLALDLASQAVTVAHGYARGALEQWRRAHESAAETAARHYAEDLAWEAQRAQVRGKTP